MLRNVALWVNNKRVIWQAMRVTASATTLQSKSLSSTELIWCKELAYYSPQQETPNVVFSEVSTSLSQVFPQLHNCLQSSIFSTSFLSFSDLRCRQALLLEFSFLLRGQKEENENACFAYAVLWRAIRWYWWCFWLLASALAEVWVRGLEGRRLSKPVCLPVPWGILSMAIPTCWKMCDASQPGAEW